MQKLDECIEVIGYESQNSIIYLLSNFLAEVLYDATDFSRVPELTVIFFNL